MSAALVGFVLGLAVGTGLGLLCAMLIEQRESKWPHWRDGE